MAKEWGPRNEHETWADHNLEEGLEFSWIEGEPAKITKQLGIPRVYSVRVEGMDRNVTEAFILSCMKDAGEDPQVNLYYSAWPFPGNIRRSQKIVVRVVAALFFGILIGCVVALLLVTR